MAQKTVRIGAEVEPDVSTALDEWAAAEGRSKREHAAVLLRKLVKLRAERPADLAKLGLLDSLLAKSAGSETSKGRK